MKSKQYSKLTQQERREIRLLYIEEQNKECWYCQGKLNQDPPKRILSKEINWNFFPSNFLSNPVHLHHDHETDLTIGAVHAYCNAVLWQYYGQ